MMYNCVFISIFIVYSWIYTYKLAIIVDFPLTYSFFFILSVYTCGFYFIHNYTTDAELGPTLSWNKILQGFEAKGYVHTKSHEKAKAFMKYID